ncbi:unnamed protein product, partial [marine sediment metagenome]
MVSIDKIIREIDKKARKEEKKKVIEKIGKKRYLLEKASLTGLTFLFGIGSGVVLSIPVGGLAYLGLGAIKSC